jgi:hypothetical protein
MPKNEMASILILLSLAATPSAADVAGELARCQLSAERSFPGPPNKGAQNWAERAANMQKRAENVALGPAAIEAMSKAFDEACIARQVYAGDERVARSLAPALTIWRRGGLVDAAAPCDRVEAEPRLRQ